jgi:hypothetical protein
LRAGGPATDRPGGDPERADDKAPDADEVDRTRTGAFRQPCNRGYQWSNEEDYDAESDATNSSYLS